MTTTSSLYNELAEAIKNGKDTVVKQLIADNQAEMSNVLVEKGSGGNSLLHIAVFVDNLNVVNEIFAGAEASKVSKQVLTIQNDKGNTPFLEMLFKNKKKSLESFIKEMFKDEVVLESVLTTQNTSKSSALTKIIDNNNRDVLKLMAIEAETAGLLPELLLAKDDGKTILQLAIIDQLSDMVTDLLQAIDDSKTDRKESILLAMDDRGNSALHWAVISDDKAMLTGLLNSAEPIPGLLLKMLMAKDSNGNTALLSALYKAKSEATAVILIKVLEKAELFEVLTEENDGGVSVLEKIISNKQEKLLEIIISEATKLGNLSDIASFKNSANESILELARNSGESKIITQIETLVSPKLAIVADNLDMNTGASIDLSDALKVTDYDTNRTDIKFLPTIISGTDGGTFDATGLLYTPTRAGDHVIEYVANDGEFNSTAGRIHIHVSDPFSISQENCEKITQEHIYHAVQSRKIYEEAPALKTLISDARAQAGGATADDVKNLGTAVETYARSFLNGAALKDMNVPNSNPSATAVKPGICTNPLKNPTGDWCVPNGKLLFTAAGKLNMKPNKAGTPAEEWLVNNILSKTNGEFNAIIDQQNQCRKAMDMIIAEQASCENFKKVCFEKVIEMSCAAHADDSVLCPAYTNHCDSIFA